MFLPSHKLKREGKSEMKIVWYFLLLVLQASALANPRPYRVVIDPGHGGLDEGATFTQGHSRVSEKNITLSLARKVAEHLKSKGIEAILTRNSDREVALPDRTALANRLKADAFLSIHMNSSRKALGNAQGIETFILNHTTDASSRRLARLENSVFSNLPVDTPPQGEVALILKDLSLDANLTESKRLACNVQQNLVAATSHSLSRFYRNRGVKQALFHVLLGANMPSVLVEAGFLNSPVDRSLLTSPSGQLKVSQAIASAIDQFRSATKFRKRFSSASRCKIN